MVGAFSGLRPQQLETLASQLGESPYRGRQIFEQIQMKLLPDFHSMTVLPKTFKAKLEAHQASVHSLRLRETAVSSDKTHKLAFETHDNEVVESVLIEMEPGTFTQCISSQAGCPLGCRFCMTGKLGFKRNLTASEIVDQHLMALREVPAISVKNIVFMGMGEPLLNYEEVSQAVRVLQEPRGRNVSPRRLTISTSGIVPAIERLGKELNVLLAVSLNAPDQRLREQLMPIGRKYPLAELVRVLERFPLKPRQRITFEYVMIQGVNDTPGHALELVKLLSRIRCKVNLIPFNPFPGTDWLPSSPGVIDRFMGVLASKQMTVTVRQSKGGDIDAACGQLAGRLKRENLDDSQIEQD